jgi:hypothetical protein
VQGARLKSASPAAKTVRPVIRRYDILGRIQDETAQYSRPCERCPEPTVRAAL